MESQIRYVIEDLKEDGYKINPKYVNAESLEREVQMIQKFYQIICSLLSRSSSGDKQVDIFVEKILKDIGLWTTN